MFTDKVRCPECRKASRAPYDPVYQKQYRIDNKEAAKVYKKQYDIDNEAILQEKRAKRYLNQQMAKLEYARIYRASNKEKRNFWNGNRRAKLLERTPKWLTDEHWKQIQEFYSLCKELQWLSDPTDPLSVDHIVPLQGKNVSGLHVPWNLQILPKSLNSKKRNKHK